MNIQSRSEERSLALHGEIARKLRRNPALWQIPDGNLLKWKERRAAQSSALCEWENIMKTLSHEEMLSFLESETEDAVRLRSSSPFTGILSHVERANIFAFFSNLEEVEKVRE